MDSEPVSQSDSEKLNEWPPAEGRYAVGNKQSPVAVCTMSSVDIRLPMDRIAISGKCVTENLGVEKIIRNVVANPNIRYIIVAGRESMGHFVDNALESLVENGTDEEGRIKGAKGGIPVLKNVSNEEIERFRRQVEIVNMAGETDTGKIMEKVNEYYDRASQPFSGDAVVSREPEKLDVPTHPISEWSQDPSGYFTIQVSHDRHEIVVEHHDNSGKILRMLAGKNAEDLYHHIINRMSLISRLDHAAYLGRELGKAETALFNNADYEQETGLVIPHSEEGKRIDTDGKEIMPLPTHGKLIAVKKIEKTSETMLTYLVNDREFPIRSSTSSEEEHFREFLKGCGMCRIF